MTSRTKEAVEAAESASDGQETLEAPDMPETVDGTAEAVTEIDEFKPSGAELVATRDDPTSVYRVMDKHDEAMILDELQERALDVMLYSFEQGGKLLTDLSYAGVQEVVRVLNARRAARIAVAAEPVPIFDTVEEDGELFYQATAYAVDELNGGGAWGTALEPKHMKLKGGKTKKDPFARTKALSKAQRNAMKALIPEDFRQTLIAMYLKDSRRIKQIQMGAGAEAVAELPPPVQSEKADELRAAIRKTYDELKGLNRMALVPGAFNALMVRHDYEEARLEEFLAHLQGLVVKEREAA